MNGDEHGGMSHHSVHQYNNCPLPGVVKGKAMYKKIWHTSTYLNLYIYNNMIQSDINYLKYNSYSLLIFY